MNGRSWDLSKAKGHGTRGIEVVDYSETQPDSRYEHQGVRLLVELYDTVIARWYHDGWLELRSGGWSHKPMTVAALHEMCILTGAKVGVYQKKFVTYVGDERFYEGIGVQAEVPGSNPEHFLDRKALAAKRSADYWAAYEAKTAAHAASTNCADPDCDVCCEDEIEGPADRVKWESKIA